MCPLPWRLVRPALYATAGVGALCSSRGIRSESTTHAVGTYEIMDGTPGKGMGSVVLGRVLWMQARGL